jgi:hypothetical protein
VDQVDTVVHLGAARPGEGLADAEELLVLEVDAHQYSDLPGCIAVRAYHLLLDP